MPSVSLHCGGRKERDTKMSGLHQALSACIQQKNHASEGADDHYHSLPSAHLLSTNSVMNNPGKTGALNTLALLAK
ncbi:hypothetical protein Anapl_08348 [Anas platyrhynchos]|uniref:Uncharacterized protein n=1 Tax=Anas platyrhynchos TaxID=8839 RepID=R0M745_ANAPL|nr:hypothetical protein Anapl_08348 [Anas platyrhynchos]